MDLNLIDTACPCNSDEPDLLVVHGPTWAVPYAWDAEAESILNACVREHWKTKRKGSVLHVMPTYLAEA